MAPITGLAMWPCRAWGVVIGLGESVGKLSEEPPGEAVVAADAARVGS